MIYISGEIYLEVILLQSPIYQSRFELSRNVQFYSRVNVRKFLLLASYAACMFWRCTSVAPTGKFAASPIYGGRGKGAPTRNMYTVGCLTIPDRFVCVGGRRITTVAALRVA